MSRVVSIVPAETDILCEGCGYMLNGLPETGNCPECGRAIAQSLGGHRRPSVFEAGPCARSFIQTTLAVLLRPGRFYRSLVTRQAGSRAVWFARWHWGIAAVLFAVAASGHICADRVLREWARAVLRMSLAFVHGESVQSAKAQMPPRFFLDEPVLFSVLLGPLAVIIFALMTIAVGVVARLTSRVAAGQGIRLPRAVVLRGLCFHSAQYGLVGLILAATVGSYIELTVDYHLDLYSTWQAYLYTLCGEVIVGLVYLLVTFRVAMGNMMYANR